MTIIEKKLKAKYENLKDQTIHTPCTLPEDDPDYFVEIVGPWTLEEKKTRRRKKKKIITEIVERTVSTTFFLNRNIASKSIVTENELPDGRIVINTQLQDLGMSKDEIIKFFPPKKSNQENPCNRLSLTRAILMEEFLKVGKDREEGNVRRMWYTNFYYTLTRILGDTENPESIMNTIYFSWKEMVESGLANYDDMNVVGGKEELWESYTLHSPYAYIIDFIEKSDYLKPFRWIMKLFGIQIIAPAGQSPRTGVYAMIRNLMLQGVDLTQTFYVLVISDLDPEGLFIQDALIHHLKIALKFYGGIETPNIKEPIRIFLRRDQVTDEMIKTLGIPYKHKTKTKRAKKGEKTKYKRFAMRIGGGMYAKDRTPLKIELNVISGPVMIKRIIEVLLEVIKESSDKSLIMIPELMREFNKQREEAVPVLVKKYTKEFIEPSYENYLLRFINLEINVEEELNTIVTSLRDSYNRHKKKIEREYRDLLWDISFFYSEVTKDIELEVYEKTKDQHQTISTKEFEILLLQQEIKLLKQEIKDETPDQQEWLKFLPKQEDIESDHLREWRGRIIEIINDRYEQKKERNDAKSEEIQKKLENFQEKLLLKFNPTRKELEEQIKTKTSEEKELITFAELEQDNNILRELKYLLSSPDLAEKTPIKDHPSPAFLDEYLLDNATQACLKTLGKPDHIPITTVEKFRDGFTSALIKAMYDFVLKRLEKVPIDAPIIPDLPEYSDKVDDLQVICKESLLN